MSQNRDAPAYQEYAATILAQLPFRTMTLQDRGLLYTMRLECWVNVRLPPNPDDLAKVLGQQIDEVAESLAAVMPFFEIVDGFIISSELENYRAHLAERRRKQSHGGKRGSAITNGKRKRAEESVDAGSANPPSSTPPSNSQPPRRGGRESPVQPRAEKPIQTQSSQRARSSDPFIMEMEAEEDRMANDYAKASRGE